MMRLHTRLLLVMALVAAVFTPLPRAVAHQTRAAFAAPAGGDAVTVWNANAAWPPLRHASRLSTTRSTNRVSTPCCTWPSMMP